MQKSLPRKYASYLKTILFLLPVLVMLLSASLVSAQDGDQNAGASSSVFLPLVASGSSGASDTAEEPAHPDSYDSAGATAPEASTVGNPSTNTSCATYIKFSNQSSYAVKVYWVNNYGNEVLYKSLNAGASYWQHTYYGNLWRVRSSSGAKLKELKVASCSNIYVDITNGHFPPTPTPTSAAPTCLGNFVWDDSNRNGTQDANEPGIGNVAIELWVDSNNDGAHDTLVQSTSSNASGAYSFCGLNATKRYVVKFKLPACYQFTTPNVGDDAKDSDVTVFSYGGTDLISLVAGQTNNTVDAGLYNTCNPTPTPVVCNASITSFKLYDIAAGKPVAVANPIVNGGTIFVQDLPASFNIEAMTNGTVGSVKFVVNGATDIENVTPYRYPGDAEQWVAGVGSYSVQATIYNGSNASGAICGSSSINFTLANRVPTPTHTPTNTPTNTPAPNNAAIGDIVFNDINRNGVKDNGEGGVDNVQVDLLDCNNNLIRSVFTSNSGTYRFDNLAAGCYRVRVNLPAGYTYSPQNQGGNEATDSDVSPVNGTTDTINLNAGQNNLDVDAGIYLTPTPTPTNTPAPQTACLGNRVFLDQDGDGIQDATEPRVAGVTVNLWVDDNGDGTADRQISTVQTITDGFYQFCGLTPGVRYIVQFIAPTEYTLTLRDVGANDEVDSDASPATGFTGVYVLAAGEINNSVDAGLVETIVPPTDTPTPVPPTPTNTPAPNNGIIGDHVFDDVNRNGIKDNGETGVDDVTVDLLDCNNNLIASKLTVGGGMYKFDNLAAGCYRIRVNLPTGYTFSPANQGSDETIDSDVSTVNGTTDNINLAAGENNPDVDAGIYRSAPPTGTSSIGNFVWNDLNKDGIQDSNEPGIGDVTVRLLDCNNNLIKTTTTAFNGFYRFDALQAGCYKSQFVLPSGYVFTLQNVGNDVLDSDADPVTGITQGETIAEGSGDNSLDGGLYADANTGTVLGTSWYDQDNDGIKDPNEVPFAAVTVNLLAGCSGNTILRTVLTDSNGDYSFGALLPGSYRIQAIEVPGYPFSPKDAAGDDSIDSDIDRVTGISDCINVTAGSTTDIDIGVDPL